MTVPIIEPKQPDARCRRSCAPAPAFLLARVGLRDQGAARSTEFERAGFTPYHYSVLAVLDEGARATQATIADALRLDRSQLVGLLDGLEQRGLIERRRDPVDRRRQAVSLTPAGKKEIGKMREIVKQIEDQFLEPLDAEERAGLHDALLRVAANHDSRFQHP